MCVNRASKTFGLASRTIREQCRAINTYSNYQPSFQGQMLLTMSSLCPNNEHQRSINDLRPSILKNRGAMQLQWSIIVLPAAFLGKYAYNKNVTMSQNKSQWSVNDFCAGIMDNQTGMERRFIPMNLSAALIGNNAGVDIPSTSYSWAPTACQDSERYTAIDCSMQFLNGGLRGQSLQSGPVFNITNMHAMSDWSDYFPCSCKVNI